jgi:hypothetical protein
MEQRLDRTAFKHQSAKEASDQVRYWRLKTDAERLQAGYYLSLRAFGYDPENEPRLDRTVFSMHKLQ